MDDRKHPLKSETSYSEVQGPSDGTKQHHGCEDYETQRTMFRMLFASVIFVAALAILVFALERW